MKVVSGCFNGTGAAVYVCVGFVPDWVKMIDQTGTNVAWIEWNINLAVVGFEGIKYADDGTKVHATRLTVGTGIAPYEGGDLLTSSNQTSTSYGEGVYLHWDDKDFSLTASGALATGLTKVDKWTLDTVGTPSGSIGKEISSTYFGVGSRLYIEGKWYHVGALANADPTIGGTADDITLSRAAPTGRIDFITGKLGSFQPIPLGVNSKAGFKINETTLNADNSKILFQAGTFD